MTRKGWRGTIGSVFLMMWAVMTSATVVAQSVQGPVVLAPSCGGSPGAACGALLATPQSPGGCGGPCGASLYMRQLVRMTPCELEQLYAQGTMAVIPPGKIRGQALLNPGTKLAVPTSRASRFVWQGKIFHSDGQTAINRFFGVRMIRANVYDAESWRDGRPALILDYSQTSLLYAPYRDEIRQVAPGLFLGLMFDRTVCPPKLKMYFALECAGHP